MKNKILHLDWGYIDESYKPDFLPDLLKAALTESQFDLLQYGDPYGLPALREEAAVFIKNRLGIRNVASSDLLITNGATAGLDLIARVILKRRYDSVVLDPVFNTALECLLINSRKVHSVKFTDLGEITEKAWSRLEKLLTRANTKLIYTIPNFNNPNGAILSISDRKKLLEMCQKYEVFIVEDDPYKLYNFSNVVLPQSIINLDVSRKNTIYITTISKLLYPGVRIGFVIANLEILAQIAKIQKYTTSSANLLSQGIALHAFKTKVVDKAISYYQTRIAKKKVRILEEIKKSNITKYAKISPFFGGFYLWLRFNENVNATVLADSFAQLGITYVPGSKYFVQHNYIRLAFSQIEEKDIGLAVERLNKAIEKFCLI